MFLAKSILTGFPLRGALVKGELYANPPIILGKGLVNAVEIESKQEWSGVTVASSCFTNMNNDMKNLFLNDKMICHAKVPINTKDKSETIFKEELAINWPQYMAMYVEQSSLDYLFEKYAGKPTDHSARNKIKNTNDFYNLNRGSKRLPPFRYKAKLIDHFPQLTLKEDVQYELYKE